ncbi:MAG: hypothetical protein A3B00_02920, partial [Candidatus Yanofskybacteria bacterium RIFCSPLOWO2_01_FULL_41_33]
MLCKLNSMKLEAKQKSLALRKDGCSLKEISQLLGVSKSSVSGWVRDVVLSNKAKSKLLLKITRGQFLGAQKRKEYGDNKNRLLKEQAKADLASVVSDLNGKIICAMIYWCEGTKEYKSGIAFTNSDPELTRLFLDLLVKYFPVNKQRIVARLHLHEYHNPKKQHLFWSKALSLPINQFQKFYLKPHTGIVIRKNYPGCISLRYYDNIVARKILYFGQAFL